MSTKTLKKIYEDMCNLLGDFTESPNDWRDENYLSDGEWLDEFYEHCVRWKNDMEILLEI